MRTTYVVIYSKQTFYRTRTLAATKPVGFRGDGRSADLGCLGGILQAVRLLQPCRSVTPNMPRGPRWTSSSSRYESEVRDAEVRAGHCSRRTECKLTAFAAPTRVGRLELWCAKSVGLMMRWGEARHVSTRRSRQHLERSLILSAFRSSGHRCSAARCVVPDGRLDK